MSNLLDDCLDDNPIEEDFQQTYQCQVCGNETYNEDRLCSEICEEKYFDFLNKCYNELDTSE